MTSLRNLSFQSLLFGLFGLFVVTAWGTEDVNDQPYVAFVAHENSFARCGPSGDYYRTDPLRLGQEVEVYLESEDGWLGIRPPAGSFSWVPADSLVTDATERSAIVKERTAVAWIGTHLGRARKYRWQVQLAEGEKVIILGKTERDSGKGPELWYRIVPPSGEFRWVHRSQIVESSEELVAMHRRAAEESVRESIAMASQLAFDAQTNRTAATAKVTETVASKDVSEQRGEDLDLATDTSGRPLNRTRDPAATKSAADSSRKEHDRWDSPLTPLNEQSLGHVQPIGILSETPIGSGLVPANYQQPTLESIGEVQVRDIDRHQAAVPPTANANADDQSWVVGTRQDSVPTIGHGSISVITPATLVSSPQPAFDPQLAETQRKQLSQRVAHADVDELQLELSRQMALGVAASVVEPIRTRSTYWLEQLTDPVALGRARVLRDRVEQYQRVARRRDGHPPVETALADYQQASGERSDPTKSAADSPALPPTAGLVPFDREGYLVQVFSARPDAPPYALTDAAGQTLAYVSPAPGVNLRMHLNKKIGLHGELSYLTGLETPLFIAKQAVRISH